MAARSLYEGTRKFDREQLIFVVEAILIGALDRVGASLPDSVSFAERGRLSHGTPRSLTGYEQGGLEAAGMSLGVLYAQLTGDGLGIGDALHTAGKFDAALGRLVEGAWEDDGAPLMARQESAKGQSYTIDWLYGSLWPNTRRHAEQFVDAVFKDYLAEEDDE